MKLSEINSADQLQLELIRSGFEKAPEGFYEVMPLAQWQWSKDLIEQIPAGPYFMWQPTFCEHCSARGQVIRIYPQLNDHEDVLGLGLLFAFDPQGDFECAVAFNQLSDVGTEVAFPPGSPYTTEPASIAVLLDEGVELWEAGFHAEASDG